MKKLLLALAVLAGGFVPGIAQNYNQTKGDISEICEQRYDLSLGEKSTIYNALFTYDLECLKYFVNEKKINIAKLTRNDAYNPAYEAVSLSDKRTYEILSFLIKQKVNLTEDYASDREDKIGSQNVISHAADMVASGLSYYKNLNALPIMKLKLLLNEGGEKIWQAIHGDTISHIIHADIAHDNINLVQFLIDQDMPLSEYDRYINATRDEMDECLTQISLYEGDDSRVAYYQNSYEAGQKILNLLEQTKAAKVQEEYDQINNDVEKTLNEDLEQFNK